MTGENAAPETRSKTQRETRPADSPDISKVVRASLRWLAFMILSAFFFHITAGTFTSFGVALPFMIAELDWTWSQAGGGFSILALMVGLASLMPAWIIRRWGLPASFLIGGASMALGFVLLATTSSLAQFFIGAAFAGFGYPLCAIVPAIEYFNKTVSEKQRGSVIGAYMMIGGLGGVAGPLFVAGIVEATGDWRNHWWVMTAITIVLTLLAVVFVLNKKRNKDDGRSDDGEKTDDIAQLTRHGWAYRDVMRTRQFMIIVVAMTMILFCELTLNSWTVTHMNALGVSTAIAAGALSGHALVNALSRGVGGVLARWIDPKWLLVSALGAEVVGMLALSAADSPFAIALFVIGNGFGFGMCLFATTLLLVNYFGTERNPELLGAMHLVTTIAMIGPVFAGAVAERIGGFGVVFLGYAGLLVIVMIAVTMMQRPAPKPPPDPAE